MKYADVLQLRKQTARIPRRNTGYGSGYASPGTTQYPAGSFRDRSSMQLSSVGGRGPAGLSSGAGINNGTNPVNGRALQYRQPRKGSIPPAVKSFEGVTRSYNTISNEDRKVGKNKYFTSRQIVDPASGRVSYVQMRRSRGAKRRASRRPVQILGPARQVQMKERQGLGPSRVIGTGYARPMTRRSEGSVLKDRAEALGRARNQAPARRSQIERGRTATRRWQDQYRQEKSLYGDGLPLNRRMI